ncbi:MAG: cyclic pyranopterin monophosphate synthase MoaC [Actinomycetota bacterium]
MTADNRGEPAARMVDVTGKEVTDREAAAEGLVRMTGATRDRVAARALDKGDALETARIAGIMAAKKTSELIPLCHPIDVGAVEVAVEPVDAGIAIRAVVRTAARTGVEMEALTAVAVAALTIYDMVKGLEPAVEIDEIRLASKRGGRSGPWDRDG